MTPTEPSATTRLRPGRFAGRLAPSLVALVLVLASAGCSGVDDGGGSGPGEAEPAVLRVFAAASLTDVMAELTAAFRASEPALDVELNLAGSATLRAQILEGAPADVVAMANPAVMAELEEADALAGPATPFATNRLVLAVGSDRADRIDDLADLTDPDLFVGLCAPGVPCGDLADRVLAAAAVTVEPDTREPDVRALLTKVEAGELDAGLVYATDVAVAEGVAGIDLAPDLPATTSYPAAVVSGSGEPEAAERFVRFLGSETGRAILADHGFGAP